MLQLREVGSRVVAEASLFPSRFPAPFQLRTQLLPVRHVAVPQNQAFLRPQPGRQSRDQPCRAHHHQARRRPPPTAGPTFVVTMAAEGVFQIVVRSRQVRRLVASKQAAPKALGHFHEMLQARTTAASWAVAAACRIRTNSCVKRRRTFFAGN